MGGGEWGGVWKEAQQGMGKERRSMLGAESHT